MEIGAHYGKPTEAKVRLGPPWPTTPPVKDRGVISPLQHVSGPQVLCLSFQVAGQCPHGTTTNKIAHT